MSIKKFIGILCTVFSIFCSFTFADELIYKSYVYTVDDLVFFSYEDDTEITILNVNGTQVIGEDQESVLINNGTSLIKGQHCELISPDYILPHTVYLVKGSRKFSVLQGDATSEGMSGYYLMDAQGRGVSSEFYGYVPEQKPHSKPFVGTFDADRFAVFAYQDNTTVTLEKEGTPGNWQLFETFTLNAGQHQVFDDISDIYIHVESDNPVSALVCHDTGYYIPAADGTWSGTKFYTMVDHIPFERERALTLHAFEEETSVTVTETATGTMLAYKVLGTGQTSTIKCSSTDWPARHLTIEATKPITASMQGDQYQSSFNTAFQQCMFIPTSDGHGIADLSNALSASVRSVDNEFFKIISYYDSTDVDVYVRENDQLILKAQYVMNKAQIIDLNENQNLLQKDVYIKANDCITAYKGGYADFYAAAEFVPLAFNVKRSIPYFQKTDSIPSDESVSPNDADPNITYTIEYSAAPTDQNDVVIVDYLPKEVDFISADPNTAVYNPIDRTVTWNIGYVPAYDPNDYIVYCNDPNDPNDPNYPACTRPVDPNDLEKFSVSLTVSVNHFAEPTGDIINFASIESTKYYCRTAARTNVNCYGGDIIYVNPAAVEEFINVGGLSGWRGRNTGLTWADAYRDIHSAFKRAAKGCGSQIWVAAGTYKPARYPDSESPGFQLLEGIDIYGSFSGTETSPDQRIFNDPCNASIFYEEFGSLFQASYPALVEADSLFDVTFDGFTLTSSLNTALLSKDSDITIANCRIIDNGAIGLHLQRSNSHIENSTFTGNTSHAIYATGDNTYIYEPNIVNCIVKDNTGIGINLTMLNDAVITGTVAKNNANGINLNACWPTITNSAISENNGTGIYCSNQSDATITDSTISQNSYNGICSYGSAPMICFSLIEENNNCGIKCDSASSAEILNNTIRRNTEDGIFCYEETFVCNNWIHHNNYGIYFEDADSSVNYDLVRNNTIVFNNAEGIYCPDARDLDVSNCILWSNNSGGSQTTGCALSYCYTADPNFAYSDPNLDNYHLDPVNSQCIDTGNTISAMYEEFDIDGADRIYNGTVDIGADEVDCTDVSSDYDFNADGLVNLGDLAKLSSAWNTIENPDPNLPEDPNDPDYYRIRNYDEICDLVADGVIDANDLNAFATQWLWQACWKQNIAQQSRQMSIPMSIQTTAAELPTLETQILQTTEMLDLLNMIYKDRLKYKIDKKQWKDFMNYIENWLKTNTQ